MNEKKHRFSGLIELIVPRGSDIQAAAFNILACCGIAVSILTAFYNLWIGLGIETVLECMAGVVFSVCLLAYTRHTGNYRLAMILTVLGIFIGLFSLLFFSGGGYHSGIPYFFIFGVVFTAFLLEGRIAWILITLELLWYAGLCIYTWLYPQPSATMHDEETFMLDVVVCETIVSISLAVTMYLQIRVYRNKQKELNAAIHAAEEANRAKSDFLAKMSHDIRTPLNTIMATNELVVANTSSARIREWVNDSNISARILLSLIDDMLDLTRIEAGRMELLEEPWDTKRLFEETVRLWKSQADKAGLTFSCEVPSSLPSFLVGDEGVIRKITNNLLSNSVKYTKSGTIWLRVGWDRDLTIEVEDTGIGIAPEYLETIFKPFARGVQEVYRETSGSGLGLAIVKELVDAMGGSIECQSTPGTGTKFSVRLPQKIYDGTKRLLPRKQAENTTGRPSKQFIAPEARILVVDDNPHNRKVVEGFLEPALIQTDDVESGFEALEMIDIKEYDLVLMDLRMPKMDGAETLERIRREYPDFHTPVVALTADIMNGIEEKLLSQGFAAFLSKPVSSARLFEMIARFIPDKVVWLETGEKEGLTLAQVEASQDLMMPYGIDLKLALEYNAGDTGEFLTRAGLFDEYADETIDGLSHADPFENYYLQAHSLKSIAKGVGAYLLAELAEAVEFRHDDAFTRSLHPAIVEEYQRVRRGLSRLREEVVYRNE
ncbi:MAG: response regulator [Lachnospiraceae bacterium]|nr:response regulator [Lachnospiraceae bacterium]